MAVGFQVNSRVGGVRSHAASHLRWLVLLVAMIAAPGSSVLFAQDARLTDRVTDETGVLENTGDIEDALNDLEDDHSVQLWVYFVDTTGSLSVTDFADSVAERNSFGGNDALLVVAINDRSDSLWVSDSLDDVTNDEIDELLTEELEPRLGDGDFDGAVIALAKGLGNAAGGSLPSGDQPSSGESSGGGGAGTTILLVILVAGLVIGGIWLFRKRSKTKKVATGRKVEADELSKQANGLLLAVDDELRDAEQELGFADAQFGESEVVSFKQALERARLQLKEAFASRQLLDDDRPDTVEQRTALFRNIIEHAEAARAILVPERERIEKLRDVERAAPEILAAMPARIAEAEGRLAPAEAGYTNLQAYADSVWKSLEGNTIEASKRLAFARETATAGEALIQSGQRAEAGAHARAGQAALAEATALIEAVEHQVEAVRQSEASLAGEIAAAHADVVAARTAVEEQRVQGGGEGAARAAALLESARKAGQGPRPDPISAVKLAQEANSAADAVLAQVRESAEQHSRQTAAFQSTAKRAHSAYVRASDYVNGRRNGIGREARTRLAEAERHLKTASELELVDLGRAMSEVEDAERLANESFRLAQQDFDGYNRSGSNPRRYDDDDDDDDDKPRRRSSGSGGGSIDMGDILGGVLGGILSSGMGAGPGFGGTGWGNYTGGKSSGGSGGGFKLPSPGGGGRSRGGGFKLPSGGGRSRGGRW